MQNLTPLAVVRQKLGFSFRAMAECCGLSLTAYCRAERNGGINKTNLYELLSRLRARGIPITADMVLFPDGLPEVKRLTRQKGK